MIALIGLIGGCAYRGEAGNPVARSLIWFSHLDATDIKDGCGLGAGERYRFVYNGLSGVQTRTYDIVLEADGGAQLKARVIEESNLVKFSLADVFAPWRATQFQTPLDRQGMAGLRRALRDSRFAIQPC